MSTVVAEHIFQMPLNALWGVIGDFGKTGKWSGRPSDACVQQGTGIGAIRTLTLQDGRVIVDRLETQTNTSYTYSIVSGPLPYKHYRATMAVEPIDAAHTLFRWTGEFESLGISEDEAVKLTRSIYAMGIGMMRQTLEGE